MNKGLGYAVAIASGAAALIVIYKFFKGEASEAVKAVGNAVNPVSDQNVFYRGTNAVGEAVTGDPHFTLGGWVYDVLHPSVSP